VLPRLPVIMFNHSPSNRPYNTFSPVTRTNTHNNHFRATTGRTAPPPAPPTMPLYNTHGNHGHQDKNTAQRIFSFTPNDKRVTVNHNNTTPRKHYPLFTLPKEPHPMLNIPYNSQTTQFTDGENELRIIHYSSDRHATIQLISPIGNGHGKIDFPLMRKHTSNNQPSKGYLILNKQIHQVTLSSDNQTITIHC